jgi:NAD(P)H-dependent FMN reductase
MQTILGISGSLRQGSFNSALLRAAAELVPDGTNIEIASIREIPLYDGDVEREQGVVEPVRALKRRIVETDAVLIVTPEYNNSVPGVLKNAIDWLSRPPADIGRVFGDRPVAVIGATPGRGGTMLAQNAWLPILRTLGTLPWFGGRLYVSDASRVFDGKGRLQDDRIRADLTHLLDEFAKFVSDAASVSAARARGEGAEDAPDGGGVAQGEIRLPRH